MKKLQEKTKIMDGLSEAFWVAAVLFTSYSFAANRVLSCDYVSINGDFQSYNVFRRMLAGQTPFVDFANYIGMAPVFVNLPFVGLENTFANSLFVTNFTSNIIFCISTFILLWLITKSVSVSCLVSALIPKLVQSQLLFRLLGQRYGHTFTERFAGMYTPSNSMRGVRSFLPFLMVTLLYLFKIAYEKYTGKQLHYTQMLNRPIALGIFGAIQGLFVLWSNDFGIACVAAVLVMLVFMQLFFYKDRWTTFLKNIVLYLLCTAAGVLVCATIVTKGAPVEWFRAAQQTAQYQFFYFNGAFKPLVQYIFTNGILWLYTGIFILLLCTKLLKLVQHRVQDGDLALVFLSLSIVAGTFAYICSGSGYNFREALEVYGVLLVVGYGIKLALHLFKSYNGAVTLAAVAGVFLLQGYFCLVAVQTAKLQPTGTYIEQLGGTSTYTKALEQAKELVGTEKVFSVYATGLEVVTNQFQPTGYDYIIHCLGQEPRQKYIEEFKKADSEFVQTPSMDIGVWVANQNWYFYREFLDSYEKEFKTEYSWLWRKKELPPIQADVTFTVEKLNDKQVKILLTSDNKSDFIADLQVGYTTQFASVTDRLLSLGRSCMVATTNICFDSDAYSSIGYPSSSTEYIPVKMSQGIGEVVLTAEYGQGVQLKVKDVKYMGALPAFYLN